MTTTITPNMSLPVPVPSEEVGPDWAEEIVADMYAIDSHDHTTGKGVPITPDGINITADLPMNENNLTEARTVRFQPQTAALALSTDLGCLYEVTNDLYYNDGAGNQVRITQAGAVTGATGTITGLPSGTASASYSGGTFTFQSATSTPATMAVGPIVTGAAVASAKTVTISASAVQPANYALTLPLALPGSTSFVNTDSAGNQGFVAATGTGSVVLAASPSITSPTLTTPVFSGQSTGTIVGGTYSPTYAWGLLTPTINSSQYSYMRVGNMVTVNLYQNLTAGVTGWSFASVTIPVVTSSLIVNGTMYQYIPGSTPPLSAITLKQLKNVSTTLVVPENITASSAAGDTYIFAINFSYIVV